MDPSEDGTSTSEETTVADKLQALRGETVVCEPGSGTFELELGWTYDEAGSVRVSGSEGSTRAVDAPWHGWSNSQLS